MKSDLHLYTNVENCSDPSHEASSLPFWDPNFTPSELGPNTIVLSLSRTARETLLYWAQRAEDHPEVAAINLKIGELDPHGTSELYLFSPSIEGFLADSAYLTQKTPVPLRSLHHFLDTEQWGTDFAGVDIETTVSVSDDDLQIVIASQSNDALTEWYSAIPLDQLSPERAGHHVYIRGVDPPELEIDTHQHPKVLLRFREIEQ
jgi:hypothetical protein